MPASPTTPPAGLRSPEAAVTGGAAEPSVGRAPPGTFAVVGPDGSGKTTLVDALLKTELPGEKVLRIRRPGVLYRRTPEGIVVTEPHAKPPYPPLASIAKVVYLLTDELLGWAFRLKPYVRRGGTVIIERGWWDLAVDPRRYRLQEHAGLLWRLGRFLPAPDLLVVLEADPEVLLARKEEISRAELVRQMRAWRELLPAKQRRVYVDAGRPPDVVLAETAAALRTGGLEGGAHREAASRWVGIPRSGDPRWILPRSPRRVATGGTRVYQPINWRAQTGWAAARAAAALGAFRLLPGRVEVPAEVASAMAPYMPAGATLAVSRANHPGRYVALVVNARGRPEVLGKVATDPAGVLGLEAEAEALRTFGARLEPPLAAPALLGASSGVLVFEVVDYRPRLRPWRLPQTVARASGAFFRSGGGGGAETGASHGDFAPWNLLRRGGRWVLIDWENARSDAPQWHDVWHYLVQGHALLGRPSQDELVAGWRGSGWVARALRAYAEGAGLAPEDSERWLDPYLEESKRDLDPSRPDGIVGLRARRRLQARLRA